MEFFLCTYYLQREHMTCLTHESQSTTPRKSFRGLELHSMEHSCAVSKRTRKCHPPVNSSTGMHSHPPSPVRPTERPLNGKIRCIVIGLPDRLLAILHAYWAEVGTTRHLCVQQRQGVLARKASSTVGGRRVGERKGPGMGYQHLASCVPDGRMLSMLL